MNSNYTSVDLCPSHIFNHLRSFCFPYSFYIMNQVLCHKRIKLKEMSSDHIPWSMLTHNYGLPQCNQLYTCMSRLNTAINKLDIHQYTQFQLLLKIVLPDCINEKACITYVKDQRLLYTLLCTFVVSERFYSE